MQLSNIRNPKWGDQFQNSIMVICDVPEIGETSIPFVAMPNDHEAHGVDIYNRAIAGEFGIIEEFVEPVVSPSITSISPRQIRQALTRVGLRETVETAVASGDQDLKDWWEFSTSFDRLHPEVIEMGATLGVSVIELDNLWSLGATL